MAKALRSFISEALVNEAKVSPKNVDKAVSLFVNLLSKRMGEKFYRLGGKNGIVQIKGGIGFLYIYKMNKAVRFNYLNGDIQSLTLWDRYKYGQKGDKTISFEGIGLSAAGRKLIDILTGKETDANGEYYFLKEEAEIEILDEANRISVRDAVDLLKKDYPQSDWGNLSKKDIEDSISGRGFTIPYKIHAIASKKPGERAKTYDLNSIEDISDDGEITIKITSGDSQSVAEVIPGERAKVKRMDQAAKQILTDPSPDQIEEMREKVDSLYNVMGKLVQVVARGFRNSLFIYGSAGVGKTFIVNKVLKEEGKKKNKDYFVVKGRITTAELYRTLFMHRQKGKLLVFDDTDSVFDSQDGANLLKSALDSYDERVISWFTRQTFNVSTLSDDEKEDYYDEIDASLGDPDARVKYPSEFPYEGRIIFISNLDASKVDAAVLSRSAKIDMTLTEQEKLMRLESIIEHLGDPSIPKNKKIEIIQMIKGELLKGSLKSVSMRTYGAAEALYSSGIDGWETMLPHM